jgi:hypothetical protein
VAYKLEVAMPRPALVKVEEVSKKKNNVIKNNLQAFNFVFY